MLNCQCKKETRMTGKSKKKLSFVNREMLMKTATGHHFIPSKPTKIEKSDSKCTVKVVCVCEGGKWYNVFGKKSGSIAKVKEGCTPEKSLHLCTQRLITASNETKQSGNNHIIYPQ